MTIEQGSLTAEPLPITVDRALFFAVHDVSTGAAVPRAGDRPEGVIRPVPEVQPGPGPIAALHGADLPVRDQTEVGRTDRHRAPAATSSAEIPTQDARHRDVRDRPVQPGVRRSGANGRIMWRSSVAVMNRRAAVSMMFARDRIRAA